jgi:hypothetical protein
MATYNEIKGDTVEIRATDPTNPVEGEVWYNSTTGVLKGYENIGGAWASANNSNTQSEGPASFGDKTGLVSVGGYGPSGPAGAHSDAVEEYDGTTWTTATVYPTTNYAGQGCGTLTSGLVAGGNSGGATFLTAANKYDGTSWTSTGSLGTARTGVASSVGTQTAGIIFGGYTGGSPSVSTANTEEFNGTSWSEQNNLSTARTHGGSGGVQTSALLFGGETTNTGPFPGRIPNATEEYDGTSWTAGGTVPALFARVNGSGSSITNIFRIGGGEDGSVSSTTDFYNGTSWASSANLGSAQNWASSGGSSSADSIIGRGRGASGYTTATQEYTDPSFATRTLTTS